MKYIKIFIASSIVEFEEERYELGYYIGTLNNILVKRGVYIELKICEDLPNAMSISRKQEDYNESIRKSQLFYMLVGQNIGNYTLEEFDVAKASFEEKSSPCIHIYFKQPVAGESVSEAVKEFMEKLDAMSCYYNVFSDLNTIKFDILVELKKAAEENKDVEFDLELENGYAELYGKKVLSTIII